MNHGRLMLSVLTSEAKKKIHHAALEVLERVGIEILHEESVEILSSAGANVVNKTKVQIPTFLVQEALNSAPSRVTIYDREGKPSLYLCDDNYYFLCSPGCLYIIDSFTQERRAITYKDMCNYARLIDSLDEIEMIGSWMIAHSPEVLADRYQAEAIILNTRKPFYLAPLSIEGMRDIITMCSIVAGGEAELSKKPFFVTAANPIPPLRIPELSCQKLLLMSEKRLPLIFNPIILAGATGPVDLFGSLVLLIANNLAELVLAQQKNRGTPVIIGGLGTTIDMRTGQMCYSGPEFNLLCGALAEMGHFYGLPVWGTGGSASSKVMDLQAVFEASTSILFSALTGAHLIHDIAFLENGLTSSFEMQLLCHEIISMTRKMISGIKIQDSAETVDLIERVGVSGNYLIEKETLNHLKELWLPSFMDRQTFSSWTEKGGLTMQDKIKDRVKHILANYHQKELDQNITKELKKVVTNAANQYG